ncbi:glycosyltransferase family 2 protein [Ostreiculturibacter nitratireducens]|uniref:glycosyltransferase family 2 protein n=1 Tax=Ostreiculturibacter nitratireducens TaxID=3075226 RepID=UPI0031B5C371
MTTLIVTAMRDEAPYLLEWVAYHRMIGVDHFLAFSNDCSDGTDAMLDRLEEVGLVTHVRNDKVTRKGVQWTALDLARKHPVTETADWILVSDVDEFVNVKAGNGRIEDLVAAVPDADAIALTWRLFGSNGVVDQCDLPVIGQFTRAAPFPCHAPWQASQIKTLFRNNGLYRKLGVHRPKDRAKGKREPVWANGSGQRLGPEFLDEAVITYGQAAGMELACLNHYSVKSAMSFLVKSERGLPNRASKPIDIGYWVDRNFNTVKETSILRHLPDLQAALAELLRDETLGRLHDAALAWHQARAAEVMDRLDGLVLLLRIVGTERRDIDPALARRLLMKRVEIRRRDRAGDD